MNYNIISNYFFDVFFWSGRFKLYNARTEHDCFGCLLN